MSNTPIQEELRNVYWIGGGPGAGKTTIAGRIAARRGLSVFSTDDAMADHARRSSNEDKRRVSVYTRSKSTRRRLRTTS